MQLPRARDGAVAQFLLRQKLNNRTGGRNRASRHGASSLQPCNHVVNARFYTEVGAEQRLTVGV